MAQFLAQKPASIQDMVFVITLTPYFYPGDHPPCLCLDRDLGLNVPLLTIYIPSAPFMPKSIAHMYIYYSGCSYLLMAGVSHFYVYNSFLKYSLADADSPDQEVLPAALIVFAMVDRRWRSYDLDQHSIVESWLNCAKVPETRRAEGLSLLL